MNTANNTAADLETARAAWIADGERFSGPAYRAFYAAKAAVKAAEVAARTKAQRERQHGRNRNGTYGVFNRCELCGKSAGADFFSVERNGEIIPCVCAACAG